jgi:hypothetical protein
MLVFMRVVSLLGGCLEKIVERWSVVVAVLVFAGLFWLWPSAVHEQVHLAVLVAEGGRGSVVYDWRFPPHPFIRYAGVAGTAENLMLLAPSLLSVVLLGVVWLTRRWATIVTHVAFPTYLCIDLVVNVAKFSGASSDFRMLPGATVARVIACCVLLVSAAIIAGAWPHSERVKLFGGV